MVKFRKIISHLAFMISIAALVNCAISQTARCKAVTASDETVVFDSEEAVIEYESNCVRQILGKVNIRAYREFEINGRLYVFTSPARKAEFDKTGEMGKSVIKIGYGQNSETVVFDSDDAVKEYDKRHSKK